MIRQITNNECLRGNATRISQYLSILVSRNPCFSFQVKSWSHWTFCRSFKFSSFLKQVLFFKNFGTLPMICKLSPVEVSLFHRKKWSRNRKRLLSGIQISPNFYQQCIFKFSQNQNQELRTFSAFSRYLKGIIIWKSFD